MYDQLIGMIHVATVYASSFRSDDSVYLYTINLNQSMYLHLVANYIMAFT